MARAATTNDVFNAIAEARRRNILAFLRGGESWAVNKVVARLGLGQVTVSKHLAVLRKIGVVEISKEGRYRGYRLRPEGLKPIMIGHGGSWPMSKRRMVVVSYKSRCRRSRRGSGYVSSAHS
jgi:DNA-binding transcriptional ArsR family regulator